MRKAISIFFILLANIAILAHAVVPHHHHNKVFAAIVDILDGETQHALNHSHRQDSHHHDSRPEECAINETLVAAAFRLQKDNGVAPESFDFDGYLDLFVTDIVATAVTEPVGNLPFIPKPYLAGGHIDHIARSLGLRAPPAC